MSFLLKLLHLYMLFVMVPAIFQHVGIATNPHQHTRKRRVYYLVSVLLDMLAIVYLVCVLMK